MALYMMIFMGGTPVGAPVIGWMGEAFGARWTLILGGLLTIAGIALASVLFARAKGVTFAHLQAQPLPQDSTPRQAA